jgi:hypothetical protein
MKSSLYPISPRTPPAFNFSPTTSPLTRSPTTLPFLSIPTKKVQFTKTDVEHSKTEILSCGANNSGQLAHSNDQDTHKPRHVSSSAKYITKVVCGANHNLSLSNGLLYVWGSNEEGQLGLPEYDYSLNLATLVQYNVRSEKMIKCGAMSKSSMVTTGMLYCLLDVNHVKSEVMSTRGVKMRWVN